MPAKTDNIVICGPVRLSYLTVYKPRHNELKNADEFGVVLLIPKKKNDFCADPATIYKTLKATIEDVAKEKFGKVPAGFDNPLKDGDEETNNDGDPRHAGYFYMRTTAKPEYPPQLIDCKKNTVGESDGWVSGDWGKAKIALFAWEHAGRKGVSAGLRAIQFLKKDEPFGSGGSNLDGFEEEDGDTGKAKDDEYDPFVD